MSGWIRQVDGEQAARHAQASADNVQSAELARQDLVTNGTADINKTFGSQFTPQFYRQQTKAYIDNATPQLDKQFTDAQKALTFSLARSGNLDSSAASFQKGQLQDQYNTGGQTVRSNAVASTNALKSNVAGTKAGLISSLNATGDTAGSVNNANASAAALSTPATYSPLGDLFSSTTSVLAQQAAAAKSAALGTGGTYSNPFNYTLGAAAAPTAAIKTY